MWSSGDCIFGTVWHCQRHEEVWPRLDTPASLWAALARCGRSSHIQAWGDGVQVLAWPGTALSVWAVHTDRSSSWTTASSFCQPPAIYSLFHGFSSIRTAVAPLLSLDQRHGTCLKTICMSRTCKLTVFIVHWRRFFLISTRHIERIRGIFCDDALYKLTFTLLFIIQYLFLVCHESLVKYYGWTAKNSCSCSWRINSLTTFCSTCCQYRTRQRGILSLRHYLLLAYHRQWNCYHSCS